MGSYRRKSSVFSAENKVVYDTLFNLVTKVNILKFLPYVTSKNSAYFRILNTSTKESYRSYDLSDIFQQYSFCIILVTRLLWTEISF
jgi:hypothetical protein